MNKRIRELALQAGLRFTQLMSNPMVPVVDGKETDFEKFAELIVRECLNVMSKTAEEANARFTYMGDDVPTVVHQMNIEKHFGVKE